MYDTFPSYYCLNTCSAGGNYVRARTVDTRLFLHLPRAWVRGYPSVYLPYILPTNKASSHSMELWGLYFSTCCLRFSTCVNFVLCNNFSYFNFLLPFVDLCSQAHIYKNCGLCFKPGSCWHHWR